MNDKLLLVVTGLDPFSMLVMAVTNAGLFELTPPFLDHGAPFSPPPSPGQTDVIVVNDEVGTAKVTVLKKVILDRVNSLLRIIVGIILRVEALKAELLIAPVADNIIILAENITKALGQLTPVKAVPVFLDQFVRMTVQGKVLVVLGSEVVQVRALFLPLVNIVLYLCSVHPDSPF